jgi:hypothetical protein
MGIRSFLRGCRGARSRGGLLTDPIIGDDGVVRNVPMMDGRSSNFAAGYSPAMWGRPAGDARTEEQRAEDLGRILRMLNEMERDIYGR